MHASGSPHHAPSYCRVFGLLSGLTPKVVEGVLPISKTSSPPFILVAHLNGSFVDEAAFIQDSFGWSGETVARYIRYVAKRDKGNEKSGFIFTDEIVVK